ncbi:MAG: hypothetical protein Q8O07_05710 [Chloroflexota bacterium]|nr:hypothetical protein [Chloroflexota bacterium]
MKRTTKRRCAALVGGLLTGLVLLSIVSLAACAPQERILSAEESASVLAYSEAKTSNMMAGLQSGDYAAFSRDFDDAMRGALPAEKFPAFRDDVRAKIGDLQTRTADSVWQNGEYIAVVYAARFTANDQVTLRVVFCVAPPHQIGGFFYK